MPGPVVGHDEPDERRARIVVRFEGDDAGSIHRLDRVVDEIDDHAANLLAVDAHLRQLLREAPLEADLAQQPLIQRERLVQEGVQVGRHRARRRHARELRELVHERLQRIDFSDDGRRALFDERVRRSGARC